ncbi:MAG: TetR family transcriptional regulator [Rhodobacter sp.]|uniref:TetR/AcrR family transcriptional regulator n=1 Tax=Pararhodobacter sp. TaxID=2127056 RepID=UPI001D34D7C1|nr:TetR/AcrR family transcriptional regulator [Pararhodobacter sp.]MCB1345702.1 TetR family transcriptional regulator [Paracoccaceae bacterium]MCC0074517.1 TetR family transcriptional regulator [Rhodobacter sp.]HPD92707.1 TetR/AcrR family transcriptional regulator [Pararhodobacter sp.]
MSGAQTGPGRRPFVRIGEEGRRAALIEATLDLIAQGGPQAATVRAIALRAGVTPGLIRHYFATKEDLVAAAHESLMTGLTEASGATLDDLPDDPLARLAGFLAAAVGPPVTDSRAVALWAASMQLVPRDAAMRAVHEATYLAFRDRLEGLIADALDAAGRDTADTRALAIAGNALLDGLWIEAGALPDHFRDGEMKGIAIKAFSRLLELELPED